MCGLVNANCAPTTGASVTALSRCATNFETHPIQSFQQLACVGLSQALRRQFWPTR
ncbi:hypothetical protein BCAR13_420060 [Paraburkholderia caribensis]|nr:hypothetical protein BCAR13_420060 [Paraburkholderia caribensis]